MRPATRTRRPAEPWRQELEGLARTERGRFLAVARRVLGNGPEAEDALQDAFCHALRGLPHFEGRARLSTWFHRLVLNAAFMRLRARRRRPEVAWDRLGPEARLVGAYGQAPPVDAVLAWRDQRDRMRGAIAALPEHHRRVLWQYDLLGTDTRSAAAALRTTPDGFKMRRHRARVALRRVLDRERDAGEPPARNTARSGRD